MPVQKQSGNLLNAPRTFFSIFCIAIDYLILFFFSDEDSILSYLCIPPPRVIFFLLILCVCERDGKKLQ